MGKRISVILAWVMIFSVSCKDKSGQENKKVRITTTTSIIRDVVQNLVGDQADVISLMGAGVDPHLYKASHGDIDKLSKADVIIYNGLHLEGKMTEIFEKMKRSHKLIAFSDGVPRTNLLVIDEKAAVYDPHIWFSIPIWSKAIRHTSEQLIHHFPELKDSIQQRSQEYLRELKALDGQIRELLAGIPKEKRILITSHDAFRYFGKEYDVEVRGLQGISTIAESGLRDVTEMVNYIIDQKIKAIFVENSVPEKALRSVVEGCEGKGHEVKIGGELFSDALGETRTPEGTYTGMLIYNSSTIVKALK